MGDQNAAWPVLSESGLGVRVLSVSRHFKFPVQSSLNLFHSDQSDLDV